MISYKTEAGRTSRFYCYLNYVIALSALNKACLRPIFNLDHRPQ